MKVRVYVTLKRGVLDPQGKTVARSLQQLGFNDVEDVRVGKLVELEVSAKSKEAATRRTEEICKRLLANPVIEDFQIVQVEEA